MVKTIQVSDEDYKVLMELSKELQMQPNHSQAFPYYWEASSEKKEMNPHDEGELVMLYDGYMAESYTPEEYAECSPQIYDAFLNKSGVPCAEDSESWIYHDNIETEWIEYAINDRSLDVNRYSVDWKDESYPSLFLSDVQGYIETNKHHLGRNPHTYAQTVWRMPKMIRLIEAIYRLNPQAREDINSEAVSAVYGKQ